MNIAYCKIKNFFILYHNNRNSKNLHLLYKSFLIFIKELLCFDYTILNHIFSWEWLILPGWTLLILTNTLCFYGCNLYRLLYFVHMCVCVCVCVCARVHNELCTWMNYIYKITNCVSWHEKINWFILRKKHKSD